MSPPTHHHHHQTPASNHSILSTFTTALSDLSILSPTLHSLRRDYLALEPELRDLMLENSRSRSLAQELRGRTKS